VAQPPERPSTLARRFDAFDQLRARAALYRVWLAKIAILRGSLQFRDGPARLT